MIREGEYSIYKEFNIPREVEIEWLNELQLEVLEQFTLAEIEGKKIELFEVYGDIVSELKDDNGFYFMLDHVSDNIQVSDIKTSIRKINALLNNIDVLDKKQRRKVAAQILVLLKGIENSSIAASGKVTPDIKAAINHCKTKLGNPPLVFFRLR